MNKKLFTLLPLLALGLVACGEKPAPTPTKPEHGSLEQPLTVAEILAKEEVQELEDKGVTEEEYFVTGVTVAVEYSSQYDNYTVTLGTGEEDGPEFKLYRLKVDSSVVMEGEDAQGKWTYKAADALKGATFVGHGKVTLYGTTYEMTGSDPKIVKVENATKVYISSDTHGKSADDPLNVTEALAIYADLATGSQTPEVYYIKAKVAEIEEIGTSYGNLTLKVSADGTVGENNFFRLYRCGYANFAKNDKSFESWFRGLATVGTADILVKGNIQNYKDAAQVASCTVALLDAQGNQVTYTPAN
jgi:uncharacterized lipoprotein NlpE involved in copper resistance